MGVPLVGFARIGEDRVEPAAAAAETPIPGRRRVAIVANLVIQIGGRVTL